MSYLSQDHMHQFLARGRHVEQWLGAAIIEGKPFLRWISLSKGREGNYLIVVSEAYPDNEIGILERLIPIDYDEPEGRFIYFDTEEEALAYLVNELGASLDKFVRLGETQQEYENYLAAHMGENRSAHF